MSDFIKLKKLPFRLSLILFFLLFSFQEGTAYGRGVQPSHQGHHWTEHSKQRAWSANWNHYNRSDRNAWSNGDWGHWRRNNYYYNYGWGSPYYSYGWYGYQLPYYTTYWDSYPSTFANYTYPSYPYNGKWYTGSWSSYETPRQAYHNTGYYSGSP